MTSAVVRALVVASVLALFAFTAAPAAAFDSPQSVSGDAPSFSSVHFVVTVHDDGDAEWTFRYRTPLNDSTREDFETYAAEFENDTLPLYENFQDRATALVANGENTTGRSMAATNFTRGAHLEGLNDNLGVVEMTFTWTNFARVDGDRVSVGDLFDGGLYVGENQRFVLRAGPGLHFTSVSPDPYAMSGSTLATSDTVTWTGPRDFTDEHPSAELTAAPVTTAGTTGEGDITTTETTNGAPGGKSGSNGPSWFVALALLVVLAMVGGGYLWYRDTGTATTTDDGDHGDDGSTPAPAVSDAEMLSDEQRVKNLLEDHGGRMRQVQIVDETDWSKSKVSMLLSDMEEDGELSRLRVGRENVVSLPGHEPDVVRDDRDE